GGRMQACAGRSERGAQGSGAGSREGTPCRRGERTADARLRYARCLLFATPGWVMAALARVLVVDDEPDIRATIRDILEDEGYEVDLAESAAAAREARRRQRPDVVLLDIWMPDLDGISLLREWNERGGLPCPVIMIS